MQGQTNNQTKLYSGKYETPEALEEAYNHSFKGYQDLDKKNKDLDKQNKDLSDRLTALENDKKAASDARLAGKNEMGDTYNQLQEFVSKNYPIGVQDAIMDKITIDKTARDVLIKERETKLNAGTPGINGVNSSSDPTVTKEQLTELAKKALTDPEFRNDDNMKNKFIAAAQARAQQLGITEESLCVGGKPRI